MVALKPVPGVVRVVQRGLCDGQNIVNVFHCSQIGNLSAFSASDVAAIALGFRNAYKAQFLIQQSNMFTLTNTDAIDLVNNTGQMASATGADLGSVVAGALPNNVAACVTWKAPRHYRGGHGRTYLPAIPTSQMATPTSWTASFQSTMGTKIAAFLTAIAAITTSYSSLGPLGLVVLHRRRDKNVLNVPDWDFVTGGTMDSRIDSQRRRLGKDR
jgi:hypothetical protein